MNASYVIVAGVDGSDGGHRALRWAAHEAARRGGTVQAVTAWRWDDEATLPQEELRRRAEDVLAQEIAALAPGLPVAGQVVEGRPADALTAAAHGADLLVLGSHGHSRVWHTVLGSVAQECISKAACPVVVIPVPEQAARKAAPPAVVSQA